VGAALPFTGNRSGSDEYNVGTSRKTRGSVTLVSGSGGGGGSGPVTIGNDMESKRLNDTAIAKQTTVA
jgi:hypothetical protein